MKKSKSKKTENELLRIEEVGALLPKPLPKSYPAVRDFVMRYKAVFKPISLGKGRGKRYYVPRANVKKFLRRHNWE